MDIPSSTDNVVLSINSFLEFFGEGSINSFIYAIIFIIFGLIVLRFILRIISK